ncbi:MAG TPA: DUF4062 domain-containing protein [Thermoanaerobaculia bacterium]|jgi:hypothetical protein|nr:DUF4062 domain-containing protein [Thermoanaerobaculia bacterium]
MKKPGQLTAMISSTALDLPEHRDEVIEACLREGVFPIGMEHLPSRDASGIRVSLEMVDQADIYIGVYAWRYGWVPDFDNPGKISITEMELNHAIERKERGELKEILVFVMHDDHPIRAKDKEDGDEAQKKLKAFKQMASAGRVMLQFESKAQLHGQVIHSLADLKRRLEPDPSATPPAHSAEKPTIPTPPAFYAEPDYIGSHNFVGREAELQALNDWAAKADPINLLLFEAIGGNGKSMLTWEWTTRHATAARSDWAGRFWYSFYEKGAVMADFCRRALAYMTERPLADFAKKKTPELAKDLLAQLHDRPWLLILDGLERVLVAYHRFDAAEAPDEEANAPKDQIANRDPRDAIRDEDDDLLRALAAAKPSKVLVSSRLTPRMLLNSSGQPIPSTRLITLSGLRPPDAEKLLRSCGIEGDGAVIQTYLTANCDNHPLVIGVLGGLINKPGPSRGDFDKWVTDPQGGAALDLGKLDLIQRRNHILRAARNALSAKSRQLLSIIALLPEAVDYETLEAFNPHLPPEPEKLKATVTDLEQRGLLQWDVRGRKYNLHPVVRNVVISGMGDADRDRQGRQVVDFFSSQPHRPYKEAKTMEEVKSGLHIARTLLKLGHFSQAAIAYRGDLADALFFNLEAYADILSLLRPFFPTTWSELPKGVSPGISTYLLNDAAIALDRCEIPDSVLAAYGAILRAGLSKKDWSGVAAPLLNISRSLAKQGRLASSLRINVLALELATESSENGDIFMGWLRLLSDQSQLGQWEDAAATWRTLEPMSRPWSRATYRPGTAEYVFARLRFWQRTLRKEHLDGAEHLMIDGQNRSQLRTLHGLRGAWQLERGDWGAAVTSFQAAVHLARERGLQDSVSETGLALAKHKIGQLVDPIQETERLAELRRPANRLLAQLWLSLSEPEKAKRHALAAYEWAWADGEPYVRRYELAKTTELLEQMKVEIPTLPHYDPSKDEPFPWEPDVRAAIKMLKAERANDLGRS